MLYKAFASSTFHNITFILLLSLSGAIALGFNCKGPATNNDIVNDIVDAARAEAILATLKFIVTCGRAFSHLREIVALKHD